MLNTKDKDKENDSMEDEYELKQVGRPKNTSENCKYTIL